MKGQSGEDGGVFDSIACHDTFRTAVGHEPSAPSRRCRRCESAGVTSSSHVVLFITFHIRFVNPHFSDSISCWQHRGGSHTPRCTVHSSCHLLLLPSVARESGYNSHQTDQRLLASPGQTQRCWPYSLLSP